MEHKIGRILSDFGLWFYQFCRSQIELDSHVNLSERIRSLEKHSRLISATKAYWSNAMFKCDILRSIFRVAPWSKCWKNKTAECYKIFGFDSPSRQFIVNALS